MLQLFFLFGLAALTGVRCDMDCNYNPIAICGPFLRDIVDVSSEISLATAEILDQRCENITTSTKCFRDYERICEADRYPHALIDIADEICQGDSPLGKAYRAQVACVNAMFSGKAMPCEDEIADAIKFFRDTNYTQAITVFPIDDECLLVPVVKLCLLKMAETHCGPAVKSTMKELISRVQASMKCEPGELIIVAEQYGIYRNLRKNKSI